MKLLTVGALMSFTAAASHAAAAMTGEPHGYVLTTGAGSWTPAIATLLIATLFTTSGIYALAASGRIAPMPLMEPVIHGITAIYLIRGLFVIPQLLGYNLFASEYDVNATDLWLSAGILAAGLIHLAGIPSRR